MSQESRQEEPSALFPERGGSTPDLSCGSRPSLDRLSLRIGRERERRCPPASFFFVCRSLFRSFRGAASSVPFLAGQKGDIPMGSTERVAMQRKAINQVLSSNTIDTFLEPRRTGRRPPAQRSVAEWRRTTPVGRPVAGSGQYDGPHRRQGRGLRERPCRRPVPVKNLTGVPSTRD